MRFSASQLYLYRRCKRAYALSYVEGIWGEPSPKQQFGSDVHEYLAQWLEHGKTPDPSPEWETAKQGLKYLPPPSKDYIVETKDVFAWNDLFEVTVILDLLIPPHLADNNIPVFLDHKTTSDLKYAKEEKDVSIDEQGLLYSLYTGLKFNSRFVEGRWVYYAATSPSVGKRKPRGAKETRHVFDLSDPHYVELIQKIDRDFMDMYAIRSACTPGKDLKPSPESCGDFGGCMHRGTANCVVENESIDTKEVFKKLWR